METLNLASNSGTKNATIVTSNSETVIKNEYSFQENIDYIIARKTINGYWKQQTGEFRRELTGSLILM